MKNNFIKSSTKQLIPCHDIEALLKSAVKGIYCLIRVLTCSIEGTTATNRPASQTRIILVMLMILVTDKCFFFKHIST